MPRSYLIKGLRSDLNKMTQHKVILKNAHTKCERLLGRDGKAHVNNNRGEEEGLNPKKLFWEINETGITFGVWGHSRVVACMTGHVCGDQRRRNLLTSFLSNFNPVTFFFLSFKRPLLKFGQLFVTCTTAPDVDETTKSNFQKF